MLVERHDVPQVSVSMLLDTGYPADQATSFAVGQLRGAFVVRGPI